MSAWTTLGRLRRLGEAASWTRRAVAEVVAAGYAVVAGVALAQSRLGAELFGIGEPLVQLTAVHYAYAGTAALMLAAAVDAPFRRRSAGAALLLTGVAPPIVALGFLGGAPLPQIGGAVLMTLGVWVTAVLQLGDAVRSRLPAAKRALLGISGLAVWIPMVLAVSWATAQHWTVPALSVPDMARTHGLANTFGFALCGLVARRHIRPRHVATLKAGA